MRVGSLSHFDLCRSWSAWGENRRCWQRWDLGQGNRQTLPLVFEGTKLPVKFLQLPVLLGLKRYHLLDVPVKVDLQKHY